MAWSGQATHAVAGQLERVVRPRRGRAARDLAGRRDERVAAKRRGACPGRRARLNGKALACANLSANQVARESADVDVHLRGLTFELNCPRRCALFGRGRTINMLAWSGQATHAVAGQLERVVRPRSRRAAHSGAGRWGRSTAAKRRGTCPGRRARLNREALASANQTANNVAR